MPNSAMEFSLRSMLFHSRNENSPESSSRLLIVLPLYHDAKILFPHVALHNVIKTASLDIGAIADRTLATKDGEQH
jgi:hypothetical protein